MLKSWMVIGGINILIAFGSFFFKPRDLKWVQYLKRPKWLVFEPAIPLIWMIIFICGIASAVLVWESNPGSSTTWLLMGAYLLLEVVTVAYVPATLRSRSLRVGTILGGIGIIIGLLLTAVVLSISLNAALLLLPYVLWSLVGTYTTQELSQENPDAA